MFHIEVRQFPNVGRLFNLSEAQLDDQILKPWLAGRVLVVNERRFSAEKAKLTIYRGPHLRPEEMGMGRGWANVTRNGEEVTARLLAQARRDPLGEFKAQVLGLAGAEVSPREVLALADRQHPQARLSDRIALAERAIWELLHGGELELLRGGMKVSASDWQPLLLAWETWSGSEVSLRRRPR